MFFRGDCLPASDAGQLFVGLRGCGGRFGPGRVSGKVPRRGIHLALRLHLRKPPGTHDQVPHAGKAQNM